MIAALWSWASDSWSVVQARAITSGLLGPPPKAARVLNLDLVHVLALLEAMVCENEENAKRVSALYADNKPAPPVTVRRGPARRAAVERFLSI